ncbi:SigE family RNA polymerase sigma factor [Terrabacter terrigena]|uniref:SigE family RNA polymerase sigma factor n=1 Tax=Terrabacter terrigena TaxID=574718 RepID=A0ABW3MY80_9MICO
MPGVATGFDEFVRRSTPTLSRAAYALTSEVHIAQDLVQETHIRIARHWDRLSSEPEDPLPYARKTLYRLWQDSLRWRARHPERLGDLPDGMTKAEARDPSDTLDLQAALAKLPRLQRALLVLRYLEGQTESQAAEILGCSLGTVQSQSRQALSTLRATYRSAENGLSPRGGTS